MNCPYCKEQFVIPDVASANVKYYGKKVCYFPCTECKKIIAIHGQRKVVFGLPRQTDKESDW